MSTDPSFLRSITGDYQEVVKSSNGGSAEPSSVAQLIEKSTGADGQPVAKALVISVDGRDVQSASNARPSVEAEQNFFLGAGALIPRYDPWAMANTWEKSSALRPCIDAYCANVDGYGFRLEPVIDLEKEDAPKLIRSALLQQRIYGGNADPVTDQAVDAAIETMRLEMQREKFKLERFFSYCCPTLSFVELRMQTRLEVESIGNAFWEVIRDGNKQIQQFERIDSVTMRLRPIHIEHVLVDTPQKVSPIHYEVVPIPRRFRTFVQLVNGLIAVYFKEFGDTRVLSAKTGNFYESREELKLKEGELAVEATEILWWSIFAPIGPYGVPRWVGATMNVVGLRASEEINFSYFDKKCIPPLAVLVSGGALKDGAADKIKDHLKETIQGRENFWSVLVIEAESSPGSALSAAARVKVELRPLNDALIQDALFQEYEKNSQSKVGAQFRLPELLRGVSQEVNRAQAMAVLQFAEQQVFEPIRQAFDNIMNRRILADMKICYWTFKTNSAPASDPVQLVQLLTQLATAGALSVDETRALASEALNKEFHKLDKPWTQVPYTLVSQGIVGLDGGPGAGKGGGAPPGGAAPPGEGAPEGAEGEEAPPASSPPGGAPPKSEVKGPPEAAPPRPPSPSEAPPGGATAPTDSDLDAYFKARRGATTIRVPLSKLLEWVTPDE